MAPTPEHTAARRFPGGPWSRRHLLAACAGLALLSLGCAPAAYADGRLVQVDVVDRDTGETLHVYRDHGKPVIAGRPGARYAVRVVNRSGERVMAVVAIDGINILTGQAAGVDQDGYVLEPWQHAELTGWRKSHSEVAAFEFTALENSYAARTGRPDDVGVIGVALFRERPGVVAVAPPWERVPQRGVPGDGPAPSANAAPADAARAAESDAEAGQVADGRLAKVAPQPSQRLGTGHGARESSVVYDTRFERLTPRPQEVVRIRYDSLPNLVAAGIAPRIMAQSPPYGPRAFPADPGSGFVPDPPDR